MLKGKAYLSKVNRYLRMWDRYQHSIFLLLHIKVFIKREVFREETLQHWCEAYTLLNRTLKGKGILTLTEEKQTYRDTVL